MCYAKCAQVANLPAADNVFSLDWSDWMLLLDMLRLTGCVHGLCIHLL